MIVKKTQLSSARQKFLRLCQKYNFCRIRNLHLRGGEPVFDNPAPLIIQDVKIGGNNDSRAEIHLRDFALREGHLELFRCFDEIGDGVIEELHVSYGLPQRLLVPRAVI